MDYRLESAALYCLVLVLIYLALACTVLRLDWRAEKERQRRTDREQLQPTV